MPCHFSHSRLGTLALLLLLPGLAPALPSSPTVDDYVRAALAHHTAPLLARWDAEERAARAELAGLRPDPELMLEFENWGSRTGPAMVVGRLNQWLPWPGTLRARASAAHATTDAADAAVAARALETAVTSAHLALELAYLDTAARQARASAHLLDGLRPVLTERVRAGGDAADLLRLEVESGLAFDAANALDRAAERTAAALATLLGEDPGADLPRPPLPTDLPDLPPDSGFAEAHPLVVAARAQLAAAQAEVAVARGENRPMLGFGVAYAESRADLAHGARRPSPWSFQVAFSLPIQPTRRRALTDLADVGVRRAETSLVAQRRELSAAAATARTDLREARERALRYEQSLLPAARGALDLASARLGAGLGSSTDLVERHRLALDLETTLARSRAEAHQAAVRLTALTGNLPLAPTQP